MNVFLTSFYSLNATLKGRESIVKNELNPYIDGSCRREPDFENNSPCITGLCRPGFVKRLNEGDLVIYTTNKRGVRSNKIVAILKVNTLSVNHQLAAKWYKEKNISIPNNLMVKETKPFDLDKTHEIMGWGWNGCFGKKIETVKEWDETYRNRAELSPDVAICEKLYCDLSEPKELTVKDKNKFSKRKLSTQTPPTLSDDEWEKLKEILYIKGISI